MANSVNITGAITTISSIDSDYDFGDYKPLQAIRFNPAGADTCIVRNGGASGAEVFNANTAAATDDRVQYYNGQLISPFLDYSACSLTSGAKVTLVFSRR